MEFPTSGWQRALLELRAKGPVASVVLAANLCTLIALPFALHVVPRPWHGDILTSFFCFLFAANAVLMAVEEFRWTRKARYAEAADFLHDAHHALRDAFWVLEADRDDSEVLYRVKDALAAVAAAYSLITGVRCRACIKLLLVDDPGPADTKPRPFVETLARHDSPPPPTKIFDRDFADANSDFWALIKHPEKRVFISNDLRNEPGYRNTHWQDEADGGKRLPYNATIVWPIRKMIEVAGDRYESETIGFLCVDNQSRNVFWRRYDFPVGAAVADALYCVIRRWRDRRGSIGHLVQGGDTP